MGDDDLDLLHVGHHREDVHRRRRMGSTMPASGPPGERRNWPKTSRSMPTSGVSQGGCWPCTCFRRDRPIRGATAWERSLWFLALVVGHAPSLTASSPPARLTATRELSNW